ncbi:LEA type 2 family protein [Haloarcula argentinensis]
MGRLKMVGVLVVAVAAVAGGSVALGVLGTPSVASVDNHFAGISNQTTTVATDLTVSNPNPVGVQLGSVGLNYTISMNGVEIAQGDRQGIGLGTGNSTLQFTTEMQNDRIPPWWATHIDNGETTAVGIDATVTSSSLGGRSVSFSQERTIETDLISQFNSTETRPVEADQPLVSDPVLYINETRGTWDPENLTQSETPLDLAFDVYNPKPYPYTITKVGYTIRMNDVTVGEGETDRGYVLSPGKETTLEANTAIQNENLDRWWVTHLQRNQQTDLYIDFYLVLEGGGEQFRVDLDSIDYQQEIETDIFGTKTQYPTGDGTAGSPSDGSDSSTGDSMTATPTPTPTETETDGGLLGEGDTETDEGLLNGGETETETATETATPTETETDDDGLLG